MKTKKQFSRAERVAYYSGMGYAVSHAGRRVDFAKTKNPSNRNDFLAGYNHGLAMMARNPGKYPRKLRKKRTTKRK